MTRNTSLALAAAFAVALAGVGMSPSAQATTKGGDRSQPVQASAGKLSAGADQRAGKKDIWGDPDAFLAKCHEAGGGASTDEDGFPTCKGADGGNIPIPMEE